MEPQEPPGSTGPQELPELQEHPESTGPQGHPEPQDGPVIDIKLPYHLQFLLR